MVVGRRIDRSRRQRDIRFVRSDRPQSGQKPVVGNRKIGREVDTHEPKAAGSTLVYVVGHQTRNDGRMGQREHVSCTIYDLETRFWNCFRK